MSFDFKLATMFVRSNAMLSELTVGAVTVDKDCTLLPEALTAFCRCILAKTMLFALTGSLNLSVSVGGLELISRVQLLRSRVGGVVSFVYLFCAIWSAANAAIPLPDMSVTAEAAIVI